MKLINWGALAIEVDSHCRFSESTEIKITRLSLTRYKQHWVIHGCRYAILNTTNSGTQSRFIQIKSEHECDSFKTPSRHTQSRERRHPNGPFIFNLCAVAVLFYCVYIRARRFISIFCQLKDNHPLATLFICDPEWLNAVSMLFESCLPIAGTHEKAIANCID